jgi:hypothetical protein
MREQFELTCRGCGKVTGHRQVGHFVSDDRHDAKLVYGCEECGVERVWGSVTLSELKFAERFMLGPKVERVEGWEWLKEVGYAAAV